MTDEFPSRLSHARRRTLTGLLKEGPNELHRSVGKFLTALKFPGTGDAEASESFAAEAFAEAVRQALVTAALEDPESEFSITFTARYGDFEEALKMGKDVVEAAGALIDGLWAASQALHR